MIATPYRLGWRHDQPDFRDYKFQRPAALADLPNSVPLLPFAPGALDQTTLGSCVVNATGGLIRYVRVMQRMPWAFETSRLFDYYNARARQGWESIDSGAYIRDAIWCAVNIGCIPEAQWPYDVAKFAERPPDWTYTSAERNKALEYRRLDQTKEQMMACLASGSPFVFGFSVYSNFPWDTKTGEVPMPGRGTYTMGGHAVLAVGYDLGADRVRFTNSWGYGWGQNGRGTIPFAYLTDPGLSSDFWTVQKVA
jgi:C1A family cysteine protease